MPTKKIASNTPVPTGWENLAVKDRFRVARAAVDLSQTEAAEQAKELLPSWEGMSRQVLHLIEAGTQKPRPLQTVALAHVYRIAPEWLVPEGVSEGDDVEILDAITSVIKDLAREKHRKRK